MVATSTPTSPVQKKVVTAPSGGISAGTAQTYEQLYAYGQAMGWMEKPFEFVLNSWLASRS